jgi:hypothetical protein
MEPNNMRAILGLLINKNEQFYIYLLSIVSKSTFKPKGSFNTILYILFLRLLAEIFFCFFVEK